MRWLWLVVVLAGCSTVWIRPPGRTVEDFERDHYECAYRAEALPRTPQGTVAVGWSRVPADPTLGLGDLARSQGFYRGCMRARGYRPQ